MTRTLPLLVLLALTSVATPVGAVPRPILVDGPRLTLRDLLGGRLELEGDLGPAPAPGARRRVYRRQIQALLGGSALALPAHVDVQTRSRSLACAELVTLAQEALRPQLAEGLRAGPVACARPLILPRGALRVEARLPSERRTGSVPVQVVLHVGEWPPQTFATRVQIDGTLRVAVAAVDLAPNTPLAGAEVRFEARAAATLPSDAIASPAELAGMKTSSPLRAGAVLRRGSLAVVPLVRRGGLVTIAVTGDGLLLTTRGVAREDGRRGDTISVLCNASSKLIRARVVDAHRVTVEL